MQFGDSSCASSLFDITFSSPTSSAAPSSSSTPIPIKSFLLSRKPYSNDSLERIKLIDSVVNCIVKLNLPLSIVDEKPFIQMISDCNNRLRLPCRQTLTNKLIPAKAKEAKLVLKELLKSAKHCSLTCDGWTSEAGDAYLGVTVHFVKDWTLRSHFLALKNVLNKHTAENLLIDLKKVISEWLLDGKVIAVSADGAYNIKSVS